jgi:hypothetical protein
VAQGRCAWVLLYGRRRVGRVVPRCTTLNLSRAKDLVLARALREVAYERANDPSKCPVKRWSFSAVSPPIRYFERAATSQHAKKGPRRRYATQRSPPGTASGQKTFDQARPTIFRKEMFASWTRGMARTMIGTKDRLVHLPAGFGCRGRPSNGD